MPFKPPDRVVEDLVQYRQTVRPRISEAHSRGDTRVRFNDPSEHRLMHSFFTKRGLKVQRSTYSYYDEDSHTLYHPNPADKSAVVRAYLGHGEDAVKLAKPVHPYAGKFSTKEEPRPTPPPLPLPIAEETRMGNIRYKPRAPGTNPDRVPRVGPKPTGTTTTVGGFGASAIAGGVAGPGPKKIPGIAGRLGQTLAKGGIDPEGKTVGRNKTGGSWSKLARGDETEQGFREALTANPDDDTAKSVYADWLEEHGAHEPAARLRLWAKLRPVLDHEGADRVWTEAPRVRPWVRQLLLVHRLRKGIENHRYHSATWPDRLHPALTAVEHHALGIGNTADVHEHEMRVRQEVNDFNVYDAATDEARRPWATMTMATHHLLGSALNDAHFARHDIENAENWADEHAPAHHRAARDALYHTKLSRYTIQPGEPLMGGEDMIHEIHDENGRVGHVWVTPREGGTVLHVNHIGLSGHTPNATGVAGVRDVVRQLKTHYPNMTRMTGTRVSGRRGGNAVSAPVRMARVDGTGSAVRASGSDNHKVRTDVVRKILEEAGLKAKVQALMTVDSSRGVRPSVGAVAQAAHPSLARYAAAWMGLLTGERKMTTFHPADDGEDTLHVIDSPHPPAHVGDYLKRVGVPGMSLELKGGGTRAYVVAPMDLLDVATAAKGLGGSHVTIRGRASRLGSGAKSDKESRAAFRQVIDDTEREAGM